MKKITEADVRKLFPKRYAKAKKYDFGSLLIIGGSKIYTGSPAFNALAALTLTAYRSGVDLVTVAAPERAANIVASFSPDIIAYPLKGDFLNKRHVRLLLELASKRTAVLIGGGLTRNRQTLETVLKFLSRCNLPTVIDADAIYALAYARTHKKYSKIFAKPRSWLLTPHGFEFFILVGMKPADALEERGMQVLEAARKFDSVILLKGPTDVISDGNNLVFNKTGNAYMTKGGTGDVLAGVAAGLVAQSMQLFDAACCAAYINGKAGDILARKRKASLLPSELIDEIARIVAKLS